MNREAIRQLGRSLSLFGLLLGTLFFAVSLTPSLLPRGFLLQGVLSGCSFAAGYLAGAILTWLWRYLELPEMPARLQKPVFTAAAVICALIAAIFLWRASAWQNMAGALMDLPPVQTGRPLEVGVLALVVFTLLLGFVRLVHALTKGVVRRLQARLPRRLSGVLGAVLVGWLLWAAADGVLFRAALRVADSSFRNLDAVIEPDVARPGDPLKSGSPSSLLSWEGLGRMGRAYVASGPAAADIGAFTGRPAIEPIRVYAGLNSARTNEERAALALAELKRVGAFERKVLVIVTPTGTGWVDPAAMDTLEYLHGGDVASVAVQYSYLTSWLSLLVEPQYGADTARALFRAVYRHWTSLPHETRPRLYLHGLSLGALSSDESLDIFEVVGDPIHGVLWSGPPFPSATWRAATNGREEGSPAWLPRFRDGSIIRFYNQEGRAPGPVAPWGVIRIAYLQYASDPVTFFETTAAWREPAWMYEPRGADVSPAFRWFPIVTQLQLGLDMALATTAPLGYGHLYAPEHYIRPWIEVTQPDDVYAATAARLADYFIARRQER